MTKPKLTFHKALDLLRRPDARMVQTNIDGDRCEYWIVPGGHRIEPKLAAQLKVHPQVSGGKDCLFPNLDQTYRVGGE